MSRHGLAPPGAVRGWWVGETIRLMSAQRPMTLRSPASGILVISPSLPTCSLSALHPLPDTTRRARPTSEAAKRLVFGERGPPRAASSTAFIVIGSGKQG